MHSLRHAPRQSVVAISIVLLGVFLVVPSSATAGESDGVQRFLLLSTDPSQEGTPETVLAFGPIHAKGTDVVLSDTQDTFVFPDGTLAVTHEPKKSSESFDEVTCLFTFWERGSYWITGGTGAYAGASGRGNYTVMGQGVGCDPNAPPEVFTLRIDAKGPIHL